MYDRSVKDLPELNAGQPVRMMPLSGERTGRWRRGVGLQQVGPWSYLVSVEGTTYCLNRVDLRPAEVAPPQQPVHPEQPPEQPGDAHAAEGGRVSRSSAGEADSSHEGSPRTSMPGSLRSSPPSPQTVKTP